MRISLSYCAIITYFWLFDYVLFSFIQQTHHGSSRKLDALTNFYGIVYIELYTYSHFVLCKTKPINVIYCNDLQCIQTLDDITLHFLTYIAPLPFYLLTTLAKLEKE